MGFGKEKSNLSELPLYSSELKRKRKENEKEKEKREQSALGEQIQGEQSAE